MQAFSRERRFWSFNSPVFKMCLVLEVPLDPASSPFFHHCFTSGKRELVAGHFCGEWGTHKNDPKVPGFEWMAYWQWWAIALKWKTLAALQVEAVTARQVLLAILATPPAIFCLRIINEFPGAFWE